jgi:formimidoylglutamate deiminase
MSTDEFASMIDALAPDARAQSAVLGVAPHSLRAVTPGELDRVVAAAPVRSPVHIHVAEQTREIEECVAWSGHRPVEWLLAHGTIDARWCLVHATHMVEREVHALAAATVAGLARRRGRPGDGTFPASPTRAPAACGRGQRLSTIVDPFAELRQLEYSQRLFWRRRNLMDRGHDASVGAAMWRGSAAARRRASAEPARSRRVRAPTGRAEWRDPALVGHGGDTSLDAAIFAVPHAGATHDARRRWVVRDGRHATRWRCSRLRRAIARIANGVK